MCVWGGGGLSLETLKKYMSMLQIYTESIRHNISEIKNRSATFAEACGIGWQWFIKAKLSDADRMLMSLLSHPSRSDNLTGKVVGTICCRESSPAVGWPAGVTGIRESQLAASPLDCLHDLMWSGSWTLRGRFQRILLFRMWRIFKKKTTASKAFVCLKINEDSFFTARRVKLKASLFRF